MNLKKLDDIQTMSSREIAEITGKQHFHVLRDCDILNENYEKLALSKLGEGYYTHPNTGEQQHREFLLTKIQCLDLITGYDTKLRIKVNRRWEELETQNSQRLKPVERFYDKEWNMLVEKQKELIKRDLINCNNHQQ